MTTLSFVPIAGQPARQATQDRDKTDIARHLDAVRAAVRDGVDVRGYFAGSLLDNHEWVEGDRMRFGIVHVDFATQRRTLKSQRPVVCSPHGGASQAGGPP